MYFRAYHTVQSYSLWGSVVMASAWLAGALLLFFPMTLHAGQSLVDYARQCEQETGISVPAFACDDPNSTLVPMTHAFDNAGNPLPFDATSNFPELYSKLRRGSGGRCDKPDRLNEECDPGSRFHITNRNADAYVVAHCRKKGNPGNQWGDIAVIQHNTKNGATCFYQEGPRSGLSNNVAAPAAGGPNEWQSPAGTAFQQCVGCHDNGPIIRSPYLSQITGANQLPGAGDTTFNSVSQPYYFVGEDFAHWKAYRVEVKGNECNTCHRMGVNNISDGGTSIDFGIRATQKELELGKNPHSAASPLWMPFPTPEAYDKQHSDAAEQIRNCALQWKNNPHGALPNSDECRITQYAGRQGVTASVGAIWQYTGTPCSGNSCPGWQIFDNNEASVRISAGGNSLYQLHNSGKIWKYTGTPCTNSCPGWQMLDNNSATIAIVADGGQLYQLHNSGKIWRFTGTACSGNSCPGWQMLDNNGATVSIAAGGGKLYQLHNSGKIWRFTGTACSGNSCPGWQMLDNNPATIAIVAGNELYQLHNSGKIWRFTGTACSGNSCPGWNMFDNNPATIGIYAEGGNLYQLHNTGLIWRFTGTVCSGNSCPGWQMLDNNPKTGRVAVAGGKLYQLHTAGTPMTRARICYECK